MIFKLFVSYRRDMQIAFWVVVLSSVMYFSFITLSWPESLFRGLLIFVCHLINFYGIFSWVVPQYLEQKKYTQTLWSTLFLLGALTVFRFFVVEQYFDLTQNLSEFYVNRHFPTFGRLAFILFTELAVAGFATLLRLAAKYEESKEKMAQLENMNLETELRFLKAQMSPHFLFNTINNIYSLTLIKSDKAPDALMKLSDLLRFLLYESQKKVPLQKEIEALHIYAELFQLRYEEPLNLKITNHVQPDGILIEPLLLVPMLENVIKHSGLGIDENAYAVVEISKTEQMLEITTDNSKTKHPVDNDVGGIGLANIKKRLRMLYPNQYIFQINDHQDRFLVKLKIPIA